MAGQHSKPIDTRVRGQVLRACVARADRALNGYRGRPDDRGRRRSMSCRHRSSQRDTAQDQQFEVQVHYHPHHPRVGERVAVVRSGQHGGHRHLTVDFPDDTRGLLPAWMTEPGAASFPLVDLPKLPITTLRDLRVLIDSRPLSSASLNESRENRINVEPPGAATAARPSYQDCGPSASGSPPRSEPR